MVVSPAGLGPENDCAGSVINNCKRQTSPLGGCYIRTITASVRLEKNAGHGSKGAWRQDELIGGKLPVVKWPWLVLPTRETVKYVHEYRRASTKNVCFGEDQQQLTRPINSSQKFFEYYRIIYAFKGLLKFSDQTFVCISDARFMPSWFDHPNNVWWSNNYEPFNYTSFSSL
jgi:hypothetical protein